MAACAAEWVDPLLGDAGAARPGARAAATTRSSRSTATRDEAHAAGLARPRPRPRARTLSMSLRSPIIGDRFMLPEVFAAAIARALPAPISTSARWSCPGPTSRWSTAMPATRIDGLKEYHGRARRDRATSSATPRSWSPIWRRCPAACSTACRSCKLIARLARRAGQHRHGGRPRARRPRGQRARPQRQRRRRVHHRRHPGRDAPDHARATRRCAQGEWRGDLYRADTTGEELSEMTVGRHRLRRLSAPGWCSC